MSKAVTYLLKLMFISLEIYHSKMHYFSGVKSFWSVQNNQPLFDTIKKLNRRNKALSIAFFDFSTLYTTIAYNKLKNVIRELINFSFK